VATESLSHEKSIGFPRLLDTGMRSLLVCELTSLQKCLVGRVIALGDERSLRDPTCQFLRASHGRWTGLLLDDGNHSFRQHRLLTRSR